jgi:hypothetical protein
MSDDEKYFGLAHLGNDEPLARAAEEYLQVITMVKDCGARICTKEECEFLGINTKYFSAYTLVAPVYYRTFTNTTEMVGTASRDFEAGWKAFEKIHNEKAIKQPVRRKKR